MGFPENKKLAKDINKNTEECVAQLEALLSAINSQMGLMNSLISSISGGYVSKDYVDSGVKTLRTECQNSVEALRIECRNSDAALQAEINALTTKFNSKRYVGSDNDIAVLQSSSITLANGYEVLSEGFVAKYSGVVRIIMTCVFNKQSDIGQCRIRYWKDKKPSSVSGDPNYIGDGYFALDYSYSSEPQTLYTTLEVQAGHTYYFDLGFTAGMSTATCYRVTVGADIVMD